MGDVVKRLQDGVSCHVVALSQPDGHLGGLAAGVSRRRELDAVEGVGLEREARGYEVVRIVRLVEVRVVHVRIVVVIVERPGIIVLAVILDARLCTLVERRPVGQVEQRSGVVCQCGHRDSGKREGEQCCGKMFHNYLWLRFVYCSGGGKHFHAVPPLYQRAGLMLLSRCEVVITREPGESGYRRPLRRSPPWAQGMSFCECRERTSGKRRCCPSCCQNNLCGHLRC